MLDLSASEYCPRRSLRFFFFRILMLMSTRLCIDIEFGNVLSAGAANQSMLYVVTGVTRRGRRTGTCPGHHQAHSQARAVRIHRYGHDMIEIGAANFLLCA